MNDFKQWMKDNYSHNELADIANHGCTGGVSGIIYSALMGHGASLSQFQSIMDTLVRSGFLTHDAECHTYHATDLGIVWANKVGA